MVRKILVCITPQMSGTRLIDRGYELSSKIEGELNILHVEKGQNIMTTDESRELLNSLFDYGSKKGGVVHGICGENVYKTIKKFIRKNEITDIILGETGEENKAASLNEKIKTELPFLNIHILKRESDIQV